MRIIMNSSDRALGIIPRFGKFLQTNNLIIGGQIIDAAGKRLELIINVQSISDIKWVTNLAYDFFDKEILAIHNDSGGLLPQNRQPSPVIG